jgi:hypothetical protein
LGNRREELIGLEKSQGILEGDLQEFTRLANKIYEGVRKNKFSSRIFAVLDSMRCLPHSLFQAYGILRTYELGRFSGFKRNLLDLSSELKILEMKFSKLERNVELIVLFVLLLVVPVTVYLKKIEIGYLADILQILTFGVALFLLLLRSWSKR